MTQHPSSPAPAAKNARSTTSPTAYAELNGVLEQLVDGARDRLGDNFIGAYLQGSFALGDFDEHSDVDFLIVTHRDISEAELPAFQAMHAALHDLSGSWAQRLEGSYFPAAILRRWSEKPRDPPGSPPRPADWADPGTSGRPPRVYPLLFTGNGSPDLVRSEHDNTQVVRWVARQKGIALAGPPLRGLIDPVSAEALRAEVAPLLEEIATEWTADPARIDARWLQAFFVLLCCRMLHALKTGEVTSKKAAADWAAQTLDPRWRPLIESAQTARREPLAVRLAPADPRDVGETLVFLGYAARHAR